MLLASLFSGAVAANSTSLTHGCAEGPENDGPNNHRAPQMLLLQHHDSNSRSGDLPHGKLQDGKGGQGDKKTEAEV